MIDFIVDYFYYLFLGILVLNIIQRKQRERGMKKRSATLYQAILVFILYVGASVIKAEGLEPKWIIVPLAVIAVALYFFRERIIPYKTKCINCGARLDMNQMFLYDANLCSKCDPYEQPDPEDKAEGSIEEDSENASEDKDAGPEAVEGHVEDAD